MKKYLILSIAVLMSVMAQAQIVGSRNSRTTVIKAPKERIIPVDYTRIFISNASDRLYGDIFMFTDEGFSGMKAGALHGFTLSKKYPFYLEVGGAVQYQEASSDYGPYGEYFDKTTLLSLNVPVNVTYKLSTRGGLYIAPYAGVIFRYNISSKMKFDNDGEDVTINMFDKDDADHPTANHFQAGVEYGLNLGYKRFNINVGENYYTEYYNGLKDKIGFKGFTIGLGYNF